MEVGGAPARVKLLAERAIDAGLQPMPLNYEMEARGFSNLGWTGEFEPHYQFTSFNGSRDLVQREPALAAAMLRAMLRGQRFAFAHPDEASGILASELGSERGHVLKALQDTARLGIFDPDLNWSGPGLERIFRNLQEDEAMPAGTRFELESYVLAELSGRHRPELPYLSTTYAVRLMNSKAVPSGSRK